MNDKHTPEPWEIDGINQAVIYGDNGTVGLGKISSPTCPFSNTANARRIVACVNALAGIPTEVLEALKKDGAKVGLHYPNGSVYVNHGGADK